jgi:hypothetical protein
MHNSKILVSEKGLKSNRLNPQKNTGQRTIKGSTKFQFMSNLTNN